MSIRDSGLIISLNKYGENSAIVKIFSQNHGIIKGFIKSVNSKINRSIFQIGNQISFEWKSRSEDSLGSFVYCDLIKSFSSKIIFDKVKLSCLVSLISIIDDCFLERESDNELYSQIFNFIEKISIDRDFVFDIADYVKLELEILRALGYGIDLTSCVVTNKRENLKFVSPKSAKAVCYEVGKDYESKLLKLPQFLLNDNFNTSKECVLELFDGLELSGFFMSKFINSKNNYIEINRNKIIKQLDSALKSSYS